MNYVSFPTVKIHLFICSSESVKEYLEEYFLKSQETLNRKVDENLCLLCIQCFEV